MAMTVCLCHKISTSVSCLPYCNVSNICWWFLFSQPPDNYFNSPTCHFLMIWTTQLL